MAVVLSQWRRIFSPLIMFLKLVRPNKTAMSSLVFIGNKHCFIVNLFWTVIASASPFLLNFAPQQFLELSVKISQEILGMCRER